MPFELGIAEGGVLNKECLDTARTTLRAPSGDGIFPVARVFRSAFPEALSLAGNSCAKSLPGHNIKAPHYSGD